MDIQKENEGSDTVAPKTVCLHLFEAARWLKWFPPIYPLNLSLALEVNKAIFIHVFGSRDKIQRSNLFVEGSLPVWLNYSYIYIFIQSYDFQRFLQRSQTTLAQIETV